MTTITERLGLLGIAIPNIMIPRPDIDMQTWSVIACDQFSSDPAYWNRTRHIVAENPSTLNLIIPECYLKDGDWRQKSDEVRKAMKDILDRGLLSALPPGFIVVERSTPFAINRHGLILSIDLESYDFAGGTQSLIRPTEGTIRDRLPPRIATRQNAGIDLPHIILLMDDADNRVMKAAAISAEETIYDFELMQNGGHITGRFIRNLEPLTDALETIASDGPFMFAVGDGNHALAAAKEIWQAKKILGCSQNHPSRYALVEVINIHDSGMHFHPIHRVLFNVDSQDLINELEKTFSNMVIAPEGETPPINHVPIRVLHKDGELNLNLVSTEKKLAVESLQECLDIYLGKNPDAYIDYIHDEESVKSMALEANRVGILMPPIDKGEFFNRIARVGSFPRKTFSVGHEVEKRYYLESRRLEEEGKNETR